MGAIFGKQSTKEHGDANQGPRIEDFAKLCTTRAIFDTAAGTWASSKSLLPASAPQFLSSIGFSNVPIATLTKSLAAEAFCYHSLLKVVKPFGHRAAVHGEDSFPHAVCETGFRLTGELLVPFSLATSVSMFLSALPAESRYYGFDLALPPSSGSQASSLPAKNLEKLPIGARGVDGMREVMQRLNTTIFPGRVFITYGDSDETIPAFLNENDEFKCAHQMHPSPSYASLTTGPCDPQPCPDARPNSALQQTNSIVFSQVRRSQLR